MITGSASTVFDLSPPESCSTMMAPRLRPLEIAHSMYFLGGRYGSNAYAEPRTTEYLCFQRRRIWAVRIKPPAGRKSLGGSHKPMDCSARSRSRSNSSLVSCIVRCHESLWFPTQRPSSRICSKSSGNRRTLSPTRKKVALMSYLRSVSSICGVNVGSGPSSKVIASTRSIERISQITFRNRTFRTSVITCGQQISRPTALTTPVAVRAITAIISNPR